MSIDQDKRRALSDRIAKIVEGYWTDNQSGIPLSVVSRQFNRTAAKLGWCIHDALEYLTAHKVVKSVHSLRGGIFLFPYQPWVELDDTKRVLQLSIMNRTKSIPAKINREAGIEYPTYFKPKSIEELDK